VNIFSLSGVFEMGGSSEPPIFLLENSNDVLMIEVTFCKGMGV
jgi:hypothetical protein